jgi:hypothetical protein
MTVRPREMSPGRRSGMGWRHGATVELGRYGYEIAGQPAAAQCSPVHPGAMGGRLIGMTDARRRLTCLASRQSPRRGGVQNDGALVLSTALTSHPDSAFSADFGWRARHRRERGRAVGPGVVGQADEHEPARAGRLPASVGRDRGQVQCPGDRLDAHGAPILRHTTPQGAPGLLSQFLSHSPLTATVHRRPPGRVRAGHGRWRTLVNAGQHCWKACWGQPLRSSNLLSSATLSSQYTR